MKKVVILVPLLTAFILAFGGAVKAQTTKRINFGKGKSSAVVQGNTGSYGVTYVLKAKSGQKLILKLSPTSKVGIKVETDGRYGHTVLLREEKGGSYEVGLEESGEYTIFVGSSNSKPIQFTLTIQIRKLTDI